jgi:hypothetical protein
MADLLYDLLLRSPGGTTPLVRLKLYRICGVHVILFISEKRGS